jgi:hypothetical protein
MSHRLLYNRWHQERPIDINGWQRGCPTPSVFNEEPLDRLMGRVLDNAAKSTPQMLGELALH